jgi:hypothetical protein
MPRFKSRGSATPVDDSKESPMHFDNAANVARKSGVRAKKTGGCDA